MATSPTCQKLCLYLILLLRNIPESLSGDIANGNGDKVGKINLKSFDSNSEKRTRLYDDEGYYRDTSQDKPAPKDLDGIVIGNQALVLSARLRWLTNEEMGVTTMQAIYDSLPYSNKPRDENKKLGQIVERLEVRFHNYLQVLRTNKITVENFYRFHAKQPITQKFDCCTLSIGELHLDNAYGCKISRQTSCDLIPPHVDQGAFNPGRNLTEVWRSNMQYFPTLKWQYFISMEGIQTEYPAHSFQWTEDCELAHDSRHRDVFVSSVQPQRKHMVIVMDHGNSLSDNQLCTAKGIAKHLLASLTERDRVSVIGLAAGATYPRFDTCLPHSLVPATYETKYYFSKFLDGLQKQGGATNHSLGFQKAFEIIENTLQLSREQHVPEEAMILYISRGLLSSLAEAKDVMTTIAVLNGKISHKVIINTYAVIDDTKPIMYEKRFLQDIADQNFQKYDVQYRNNEPVKKGTMLAVNTTKDLSTIVGKFYLGFRKNSTSEDPVISLPYLDEADRALVISISQPCLHEGRLIGVTGIDLHLEEIAQDVTYYNPEHESYTFIISIEGYTIMHPTFSRPVKSNVQPMHTDIWHFENIEGFLNIRSKMLRSDSGSEILLVRTPVSGNQSISNDTPEHFYAKYIWKKVDNAPIIVVIKIQSSQPQRKELKYIHVKSLRYHRIDLLPTEKMCLHLKQLSTLDSSTVFLSPGSFVKPYEHLSQEVSKRMVQGYIAFLEDDTRLITNPGLKDEVRNDVAATAKINAEWLRRFHTSSLNDYIIRRYIATPSGVFRMFPGTLIDKTYDPTKRAWYERAMSYPGRVTLSAPYLDVGGAGYIITISHTVFEGKPPALRTLADKIVGVMGIDITLGYFYKELIRNSPPCLQKTVRCFMLDDRGYLIAHPGLIEPNGKGPLEQQHITHKEPLIANDILNHKGFVKKKLCNRYNDRTVQRVYHFNTSLSGVLTNLVHGEHCARYQITPIRGTNAFLGIVNQTCESTTAFCPCSMVDRLCLNCHRMEQSECECPCECPLEMDLCTGKLLEEEDLNPSCLRFPEVDKLVHVNSAITSKLHQCYKPRCGDKKTKMDCFGVLDCEWCQLQADGTTPLETPYCDSQRVCFAGVLGARTPYSDEIRAIPTAEEPLTVKSTPVGPVAGGIMGCFLVLALGVYCYRHHIHRRSHQYITTIQDHGGRISHYYEAEDQPQEEVGAGHTNFVLATFDNPATVSPYRVNTSYRRPAGGDSDHGYSTMTPHEDSEHASLPCLEPLLINKDRYKPAPYATSKTPILPPPPPSSSRRSRSPTPPQTRLSGYHPIPEQTMLPLQTAIPEFSHNVIANVQVHMVDTH